MRLVNILCMYGGIGIRIIQVLQTLGILILVLFLLVRYYLMLLLQVVIHILLQLELHTYIVMLTVHIRLICVYIIEMMMVMDNFIQLKLPIRIRFFPYGIQITLETPVVRLN